MFYLLRNINTDWWKFTSTGVFCPSASLLTLNHSNSTPRKTLAVFLLSGHLDHSLWGSVKEYQFLKQSLLQLHLSCLSHHENVCAELQDPVYTRQLLKHDRPGDPIEEFPDEFSNDQHHWHVQAYNADRVERYKTSVLIPLLYIKSRFEFHTNFLSGTLLLTRVLPGSPHWRGWLYHWTPLSRCCDTCVRMRRELESTLPPPTTVLHLFQTSRWPAEVWLTWAWRKTVSGGLDGLSGLREDMPQVKLNSRI